jgi:hypothetical protein
VIKKIPDGVDLNKIRRAGYFSVHVYRLSALRSGQFHVHVDKWWMVDSDGNPLFYDEIYYPMCNVSEFTCKHLTKQLEKHLPLVSVKQLPLILTPIRL